MRYLPLDPGSLANVGRQTRYPPLTESSTERPSVRPPAPSGSPHALPRQTPTPTGHTQRRAVRPDPCTSRPGHHRAPGVGDSLLVSSLTLYDLEDDRPVTPFMKKRRSEGLEMPCTESRRDRPGTSSSRPWQPSSLWTGHRSGQVRSSPGDPGSPAVCGRVTGQVRSGQVTFSSKSWQPSSLWTGHRSGPVRSPSPGD